LRPCRTPSASLRVRTIIAISSSEQLPARSPIPFTATSTWRRAVLDPRERVRDREAQVVVASASR
jgi:hypothetical protein